MPLKSFTAPHSTYIAVQEHVPTRFSPYIKRCDIFSYSNKVDTGSNEEARIDESLARSFREIGIVSQCVCSAVKKHINKS